MSEDKWVIQKWRTGDRFEGLTIPEALSMLFSLAEEGGYKVFVGSPGLHPNSTILPVVNIDPESRGGHFRLMLDAPEPVDEWKEWARDMPPFDDSRIDHESNEWLSAVETWFKKMPSRCKCAKGGPE